MIVERLFPTLPVLSPCRDRQGRRDPHPRHDLVNATLSKASVIAAFLAFCRIGGCFLLMPGLSSARVPHPGQAVRRARRDRRRCSSICGTRSHRFASRKPAVLLALIVSELLIGALIGLMARLYVLALQFIGVGDRHADRLWRRQRRRHRGAASRRPRSAAIISFSALLLLFVFDFHHEIIKALVAVLRPRADRARCSTRRRRWSTSPTRCRKLSWW